MDSTNVYADFEVNLNIVTENVGTYEYVTAATLDTSKIVAKPAASLLLYYPSEDENLWDIAKNTRPQGAILSPKNGIAEDGAAARSHCPVARKNARQYFQK